MKATPTGMSARTRHCVRDSWFSDAGHAGRALAHRCFLTRAVRFLAGERAPGVIKVSEWRPGVGGPFAQPADLCGGLASVPGVRS
jgi:hypothetical protein